MRMSLAEKGRFAAPPILRAPLEAASAEVQSWPDIVSATHWHYDRSHEIDGADFYVGKDELGHIHVDGELHLATSPTITRAVITKRLATRFRWSGDEWTMFMIRSDEDARHAIWLLRLGYDHLCGASEGLLIERIYERASLRSSTRKHAGRPAGRRGSINISSSIAASAFPTVRCSGSRSQMSVRTLPRGCGNSAFLSSSSRKWGP